MSERTDGVHDAVSTVFIMVILFLFFGVTGILSSAVSELSDATVNEPVPTHGK